jgi:hypothetical protein
MKFRCGDRVFKHNDPRHIGRIEAITSVASIKIKWEDHGVFEYVSLFDAMEGELIRVRTLCCGCVTDGSVICKEHDK